MFLKDKKYFSFYSKINSSYDKIMNNLPLKERKEAEDKIYKLAKLNTIVFQLGRLLFSASASRDNLSGKYTYDSYKAITIVNWVFFILILLFIAYSLIKDRLKMIFYIHNLN